MKTVRLTGDFPQLIDGHSYIKGDVVHVRDEVADEKIRHKAAELAEGQPVSNAEVNHLADALDPPGPIDAEGRRINPPPRVIPGTSGLIEEDRATNAGRPKAAAPKPKP